jgi:hypothetical protein
MSRKLFGRKTTIAFDDLAFDDLRIDFDIEKTLKSEPNSGKFKVYNLSRDRTEMILSRAKDTIIRFEAGYEVTRLLFQGNPTKDGIEIEHDGVERILKINAQDGLNAYKGSRIGESIQSGTSIKDAVKRIVKKIDLPAGKIEVPSNRQLTQGIVLDGRGVDILTRLANRVEADFSIQDGRIQFVATDETNENQGVLFSGDNGNLLQSPSQKDTGVKVKGLLDATVNPGDIFELDAEILSGLYKAKKVRYKGSKWEDNFMIEIEGEEI